VSNLPLDRSTISPVSIYLEYRPHLSTSPEGRRNLPAFWLRRSPSYRFEIDKDLSGVSNKLHFFKRFSPNEFVVDKVYPPRYWDKTSNIIHYQKDDDSWMGKEEWAAAVLMKRRQPGKFAKFILLVGFGKPIVNGRVAADSPPEPCVDFRANYKPPQKRIQDDWPIGLKETEEWDKLWLEDEFYRAEVILAHRTYHKHTFGGLESRICQITIGGSIAILKIRVFHEGIL
jgi:hypothetical protein